MEPMPDTIFDCHWSEELNQALAISSKLDDDVLALFDVLQPPPASTRVLVSQGLARASIQHGLAQRLLIHTGLQATALALVRLQYETAVRALWVHHCATDEWIASFTAPVADGQLSEPIMGPPMPAMLESLGSRLPAGQAEELKRLLATVRVMHSFVHGGVHTVVQAWRGEESSKLVSVLRNRDLLLWFACKALAASSVDQMLHQRIHTIFQTRAAASR